MGLMARVSAVWMSSGFDGGGLSVQVRGVGKRFRAGLWLLSWLGHPVGVQWFALLGCCGWTGAPEWLRSGCAGAFKKGHLSGLVNGVCDGLDGLVVTGVV